MFTSRKKATDGLNSYCKECNNESKFPRQEIGEKNCDRCNLTKDVSLFVTRVKNKSCLAGTCSDCYTIYIAKRLSKLDIFISYLCSQAKLRAKKRNLEYDIDKDDIITLWKEQKQTCIGTGYVMTHIKNPPDPTNIHRIALSQYYNMSIDRINNNLGYIKGNIQLCTVGHNFIKYVFTEDFVYSMARNIDEYDGTLNKVKTISIIERFIRTKLKDTSYSLHNRSKLIKLDITQKDLYTIFEKQGGLCALSGRPMTFYTSSRLRSLKGRKNLIEDNYFNLKDYTIDNVQLVCLCVNMMKKDMPQDMFLDFCKAIAKTHPI
uniref:Zn-finger protein n=1 Tax=Pithovirus LCPAC401 TaxID=2506595 RepID=A0A481Z9P7_9VIRU|nr:MAG: Zn-finger protein [Pithovirus LCPAC401]